MTVYWAIAATVVHNKTKGNSKMKKEHAKKLCHEIVEYLEENYETSADCCGENDEIITLPAKEILEKAKVVKKYIEKL